MKSPVRTRTPTYYLAFKVGPGGKHEQPVPKGWTTFVYTIEGVTKFGKEIVKFNLIKHGK